MEYVTCQYTIGKDPENCRVNIQFETPNQLLEEFFRYCSENPAEAFRFDELRKRNVHFGSFTGNDRTGLEDHVHAVGWDMFIDEDHGLVTFYDCGQLRGELAIQNFTGMWEEYLAAVLECEREKAKNGYFQYRVEYDPVQDCPRVIFSESERWCREHPECSREDRRNPLSVAENVAAGLNSLYALWRFSDNLCLSKTSDTEGIGIYGVREEMALLCEERDDGPVSVLVPQKILPEIAEAFARLITEQIKNRDYAYRLKQYPQKGYVTVQFAENAWWHDAHPEEIVTPSEFSCGNGRKTNHFYAVERLLRFHVCYAQEKYLAEMERHAENNWTYTDEFGKPHVDSWRLAAGTDVGICGQEPWAQECPNIRIPDGFVWISCDWSCFSFLPQEVFRQLLRDCRKACLECCRAHLQWLKRQKYRYAISYNRNYNQPWLRSAQKSDPVLDMVNDSWRCFLPEPVAFSRDSWERSRNFAYLFQEDWVVFGECCQEGYHTFHCLPLTVFRQIRQDMLRVLEENAATPQEKSLKKQWRQVQLSGKMWPMP